jgi:hypothetical protein
MNPRLNAFWGAVSPNLRSIGLLATIFCFCFVINIIVHFPLEATFLLFIKLSYAWFETSVCLLDCYLCTLAVTVYLYHPLPCNE